MKQLPPAHLMAIVRRESRILEQLAHSGDLLRHREALRKCDRAMDKLEALGYAWYVDNDQGPFRWQRKRASDEIGGPHERVG